MQKRWLVSALVAASFVGFSSSASAQTANGFGSKGQLIVSADRLLPVFSYTSVTESQDIGGGRTQDTTVKGASIALLWGNEPGVNASAAVHSTPRAGVDFTIIDRLTLGGSIALGFGFGNDTRPSTTVFGVSPRAGYILPLTDMFAFWPRAGFSFYSVSSSQDTTVANQTVTQKTTGSTFSLDLDPQFAFVPFEHLFFNFGPTLNIPLTGTVTNSTSSGPSSGEHSNDMALWHFGLNAGIGGWFSL